MFRTALNTVDENYLENMSKDGVWAKDIIIDAISLMLNLKINIINFEKDVNDGVINPAYLTLYQGLNNDKTQTITLLRRNNNHYDAIVNDVILIDNNRSNINNAIDLTTDTSTLSFFFNQPTKINGKRSRADIYRIDTNSAEPPLKKQKTIETSLVGNSLFATHNKGDNSKSNRPETNNQQYNRK